jgi:hypothetical protein
MKMILAKFKHIYGEMEALKSWFKIGVCHPLDRSLTVVVDGSSFNIKWKLDFDDGMNLKHRTPTPLNQP